MSGDAPAQPMYVTHERWYMPPTSLLESYASITASGARMSFPDALAAIQRWKAAQVRDGGGMSDFWMVPA